MGEMKGNVRRGAKPLVSFVEGGSPAGIILVNEPDDVY